jgi:PQQ-dependent dehydrogenase (methanol/ethanol family)
MIFCMGEIAMKTRNLRIYPIRFGMPLLVLVFSTLCLGPSAVSANNLDLNDLDWRNHGNDLANTRFQNVDQINPSNVATLQVAWVFHTGVLDPLAELQASPIVTDSMLFVTDGHDNLFALEAATGRVAWAYKPLETGEMAPLELLTICCGRNNKGVAVGDGKVFYGRMDDVVVALDEMTGAVLWTKTLANFADHYAINNAPQFVDGPTGSSEQQGQRGGLVIISLSGGEYEVRGQVFALDSQTGDIIWKFFTPLPSSYAGDSFLRGGAAVWNPPAIDTEQGMVYLVTGNAAPDILGEERAGNNLYATSVLALDLWSGAYRWHFQAVHHDIWDYDSAQPAVLFPLTRQGTNFQALGHCSKNGQYYILDRTNGQPIFPVTERSVPTTPSFQHPAPTQPFSAVEPLTPLTFVRPNDTGFPAREQYTPPGEVEFVMVPGDDGGCEWNPAAYSPRTKFIYYGTRYEPTTFKTRPGNKDFVIPAPPLKPLHLGSTFTNRVPGSHPFGVFGATNTQTGQTAWKIEVPFPAKSGVAVAGDLVFFGESNGKLHAVHAQNGATLFTFDPAQHPEIPNVGGANASPVVYVANGREFIAYAFGGNVPDRNNFSFLDTGVGEVAKVGDAIIAFALPEREKNE